MNAKGILKSIRKLYGGCGVGAGNAKISIILNGEQVCIHLPTASDDANNHHGSQTGKCI
jgi:hypothetical protein